MKFKRLTKPQFLRGVDRAMLARLFGKFSDALDAKKVALPQPDSSDEDYFKSLAAVTMNPDVLPDDLIEALFAIEELANDEGHERLQIAAEQADLGLKFDE